MLNKQVHDMLNQHIQNTNPQQLMAEYKNFWNSMTKQKAQQLLNILYTQKPLQGIWDAQSKQAMLQEINKLKQIANS